MEHILSLEKTDPRELFGPADQHLRSLEQRFPSTRITARGRQIKLSGPDEDVRALVQVFHEMMAMQRRGIQITPADVRTMLSLAIPTPPSPIRTGEPLAPMFPPAAGASKKPSSATGGFDTPQTAPASAPQAPEPVQGSGAGLLKGTLPATYSDMSKAVSDGHPILHTHAGEPILARTPGQQEIVHACAENDIVFAIGPAGTGKTFTSVALAVAALKSRAVKKIILARPAVEAGETLGFLPGAIKEKIDPYLRPLYDALEEMIDHDRLEFNLAKNIIEIAPLAYMRGRTLNHAFVILDEAQNATHTQMKMFLTRIGFHSRAIITGDITQTDLPKTATSGLVSIQKILRDIPGIGFVNLGKQDVVRHRLVRDIIRAYEQHEDQETGP